MADEQHKLLKEINWKLSAIMVILGALFGPVLMASLAIIERLHHGR